MDLDARTTGYDRYSSLVRAAGRVKGLLYTYTSKHTSLSKRRRKTRQEERRDEARLDTRHSNGWMHKVESCIRSNKKKVNESGLDKGESS